MCKQYEIIDEYEYKGYRITLERPLLSESEKIERSKRIGKQLKNVLIAHKKEVDVNKNI
jgi:hypothetical protein